ncbi:hypothetical protein [Intrasporangium flavum]|uniref:hypothetical protein n=1 Tax=Intrasporangium flavum TaxID=1428657 RepID=UPI0009701A5D|nr:hypothetical protein [Intrasporangium flavum]
MTTQTSTTSTSTSNAERIRAAIDAVAKRIRIQDFDVVGIQGTTYANTGIVTVSLHVDTFAEIGKVAAYLQLKGVRSTVGGITIVGPSPVTGLAGAKVEVFGPSTEGSVTR